MNNNFTVLRIFSAWLVLVGHTYVLVGVPEKTPLFLSNQSISSLGVYIFFAISGYLVTISWLNDPNIFRFFVKRSIRIFPALLICITATIIVSGLLLTKNRAGEFFMSPQTWGYLKNIILLVSYQLPGVFEDNIYKYAVNGSLWTLPVEFSVYLILALSFFIFRTHHISLILLLVSLTFTTIFPKLNFVFYSFEVKYLYVLGAFFFSGSVIACYKLDRFSSVTLVVACVCLLLASTRWPTLNNLTLPIFLSYIVIATGTQTSKILSALHPYDYSYGFYIYAFPVQQVLVMYLPSISPSIHIAASTFATLILAKLSWDFIEKPSLKFKPRSNQLSRPLGFVAQTPPQEAVVSAHD